MRELRGQRDLRARLDEGLERMGIAPAAPQRACLIEFLQLLERWNRAYNLTAVRDPWEMVPRHLLDSLSVLPYLTGEAVLDVGTGAGLPGIPLAILERTRAFFLLDSSGKKTRFVRQAAMELGLDNVMVVQARAESYRPGRKFATIVTRAVAGPRKIVGATRHLLARPGRLLVMAGRTREMPAVSLDPRPDAQSVYPLAVPFLVGERHLFDFRYD